jgi:endonuclease III
MKERIPIVFSAGLRPEWIDFALEQYLSSDNIEAYRQALQDYLSAQIKAEATREKTVSLLQRCVGYRSEMTREQLQELYEQMHTIPSDERNAIRLHIISASVPFFADCVTAIKKIGLLGIKGIEISQIYERLVAKYGERGTVYRRVRYVLQTLAFLGVVTNRERRWYLESEVVDKSI